MLCKLIPCNTSVGEQPGLGDHMNSESEQRVAQVVWPR